MNQLEGRFEIRQFPETKQIYHCKGPVLHKISVTRTYNSKRHFKNGPSMQVSCHFLIIQGEFRFIGYICVMSALNCQDLTRGRLHLLPI